MDGEITIGTKLDTDKFDRQISQLEKKMKKEEDKKIEIEAKIKDVSSEKIDKQIQNIKDKIEKTTNAPATLKVNADIAKMEKELQQYDLAREKVKEYKQQLNELEQKQREMRRANPTLATSRDTGEYKQVKDDIQEISRLLQENNKKILEGAPHIDQVSNSLDKLKEKQSTITNKVLEYKNTLDTLNTQKQQEINNKTEQYKKQLQEINQNVSEYKQKIENVKIQRQVADVEKLKSGFNSVGSSIQGAVKHVARLALGIFGIRSAFMFVKRASSDLASYDQQYATNLEYIRYALTQMIAPVLQWIVNLAAKLLGYINAIMQGWFGINLFSRGSAENFNKMKAGASGASKAVKQIKKDLAGFDEINKLTDQSDTGTSVGAGGVGMPNFDLSKMQGDTPKWLQWIIDHKDEILSVLTGIGAGLVFLKLGELAKNLGLIKGEMLGIKAIGFGILVKGIIDLISSLRDYLKDTSWENFGKVIQGIGIAIVGLGILIGNVPLIVAGAIVLILGLLAKNWDKIREDFNKAIDWIKGLGDKAWQWFFSNIDTIKEKFGWLGLGIVSTFIMAFDWITKLVAGIVEVIRDLLDGLFKGTKQILDGIIQIFRGNFKSGIISILKGIANLIIGVLNGLISGINAIIYPVRAIIAGLGSVMGKNWSIGTIRIPKIPYVKTGAIINMPNKGTMVGGAAMGGEAGREGVVPLTDQQAMAQLGAEIGRNVVVNLTNITKVGNRQIAREIKQINAEQEFAFNS